MYGVHERTGRVHAAGVELQVVYMHQEWSTLEPFNAEQCGCFILSQRVQAARSAGQALQVSYTAMCARVNRLLGPSGLRRCARGLGSPQPQIWGLNPHRRVHTEPLLVQHGGQQGTMPF